MNDSLQRYVDFRQMMLKQAEGQRSQSLTGFCSAERKSGALDEGLLLQRSANLQEAVAQIEAMRLTLKAVSEIMAFDASVERQAA